MTRHLVVFIQSQILPEYEHVVIFKEDAGFWHMLDFMATGNIDIRVVSEKLVSKVCARGRFIELELPQFKPWRTGTILSVSCVSLAKAYLGIKESAVLTSNDLYRYLNGEKIGLWQRLVSPFRWAWLWLGFAL